MADGAGATDDLVARCEALQARLVRVEAAEGVRALLARLAHWLDSAAGRGDAVTQEGVSALFRVNAVVDMGELGSAEGSDEVCALLRRVAKSLRFARTHVTNVVVTVPEDDPTTATAAFYLLTAATTADGGAGWALESCTATARKGFDDVEWRLRSLRWETIPSPPIFTPYHGPGWHAAPSALRDKQAADVVASAAAGNKAHKAEKQAVQQAPLSKA